MDGIATNIIWAIALIAIFEGIRTMFKQRGEDKNITRLYDEYNTPDDRVNFDRRSTKSMVSKEENTAYGQDN